MNSPTFTIIVPVYNAALTLADTVASVLAQTDHDFELLLIDDGSEDSSLAEMLRLAGSDDRIRALSRRNEGVAATRNLGVELARGQIIAFLDADDYWHPTKLARHRALHEADPALGASFAQISFVEHDAPTGAPARTLSTVPAGNLSLLQLIGENPICTASNLVVTADCLRQVGGFAVGMNYAEDQEWLVRAAAAGFVVRGIDALLVDYRMSPDGLSSNLERMYDGWRGLVTPYRDLIDFSAAEATYCRYLSRRALRSGGPATAALRFALRGLRCDARAFFADLRRGGMTFAGALVSPALPVGIRTRVFA